MLRASASLGGTFGGNPAACEAALAVLDIIEKENLCARANVLGERFRKRAAKWQAQWELVGDVRGLGAMQALELVRSKTTRQPADEETEQVSQYCYEHGLVTITAGSYGNVIRLLMPLVITDAQMDEAMDVLEAALAHVAEGCVGARSLSRVHWLAVRYLRWTFVSSVVEIKALTTEDTEVHGGKHLGVLYNDYRYCQRYYDRPGDGRSYRKHTLFEWSAQSKVDPIPVARAKGIYFWTPEGKRFIDFNSQLMSVNIGHGDERVIQAIAEQAAVLAYANPFMATEPRARLGAKLAEIAPGDIDTFFFTNGGAEANENAIKIARFFTGRHKIMARYRSYHGATAGAISLTGDPRRWAVEPGLPGVVHVLDPYHGIERGWESAETSLAMIEEIIQLEGPHTIAAFILEPVTGTNGILVPPDGYLEGRAETVRQVRDSDDRR